MVVVVIIVGVAAVKLEYDVVRWSASARIQLGQHAISLPEQCQYSVVMQLRLPDWLATSLHMVCLLCRCLPTFQSISVFYFILQPKAKFVDLMI